MPTSVADGNPIRTDDPTTGHRNGNRPVNPTANPDRQNCAAHQNGNHHQTNPVAADDPTTHPTGADHQNGNHHHANPTANPDRQNYAAHQNGNHHQTNPAAADDPTTHPTGPDHQNGNHHHANPTANPDRQNYAAHQNGNRRTNPAAADDQTNHPTGTATDPRNGIRHRDLTTHAGNPGRQNFADHQNGSRHQTSPAAADDPTTHPTGTAIDHRNGTRLLAASDRRDPIADTRGSRRADRRSGRCCDAQYCRIAPRSDFRCLVRGVSLDPKIRACHPNFGGRLIRARSRRGVRFARIWNRPRSFASSAAHPSCLRDGALLASCRRRSRTPSFGFRRSSMDDEPGLPTVGVPGCRRVPRLARLLSSFLLSSCRLRRRSPKELNPTPNSNQ